MDSIFKALGDPARRALLDSLRAKDGQTLTELEEQLDMTRFGVMKHLKVLEDANLVLSRKVGRFKYHYLNALPLQETIDRWIDPFLKPQARDLSALKSSLEGNAMTEKPDFMMATFINCTHDALWEALITGDLMAKYHFACDTVRGNTDTPGAQADFLLPDGSVMLSNRVISIDPKSRIELAFQPGWGENTDPSRCVYMVEPTSAGMKLTVEHYDLGPGQEGVADGWARYLAGLKTFMETGETVRFAMGGM